MAQPHDSRIIRSTKHRKQESTVEEIGTKVISVTLLVTICLLQYAPPPPLQVAEMKGDLNQLSRSSRTLRDVCPLLTTVVFCVPLQLLHELCRPQNQKLNMFHSCTTLQTKDDVATNARVLRVSARLGHW